MGPPLAGVGMCELFTDFAQNKKEIGKLISFLLHTIYIKHIDILGNNNYNDR